MNLLKYSIPVFLFLVLAGCVQKVETTEESKPKAEEEKKWVEGEILVKFKPDATDSIIDAINTSFGASILSKSEYTETYRIKIPEGKLVEEMVEVYKKNAYVEFAEPNRIVKISPIERKGEILETEEGTVK